MATAIASPKLLIHVFVGSKLRQIAEGEDGDGESKHMDGKTKMLNYLSILLGLVFGLTTGVVIYRQTKRRAKELEEREAEGRLPGSPLADRRSIHGPAAGLSRPSAPPPRGYSDDPVAAEAGGRRSESDAISLHTQDEEQGYRDYASDDSGSIEHDPFTDADDDEDIGQGKG